MAPALAVVERPEVFLYEDRLGSRFLTTDATTGDCLQVLRVDPAFVAVPSFEFALRARVARLARVPLAGHVRVRRVERLQAPAPGLALISDHIEGTRLSDLLCASRERGVPVDISTALCLIRQLAGALARLHETARDLASGIIAPERLVVTSGARLMIGEGVPGAAIEQLQFGPARLWREFRIPVLPHAVPRFDQRLDVRSLGLVALTLVLGRPIAEDEYPEALASLLDAARERSTLGYERSLSAPLRAWLVRTLELDPQNAFRSAADASLALERIAADETLYVTAPISLEMFLKRCADVTDAVPARVAPIPRPPRPAPLRATPDDAPAALPAAPVPGTAAAGARAATAAFRRPASSPSAPAEPIGVPASAGPAPAPRPDVAEHDPGDSPRPGTIDWDSLDRGSSGLAAPGEIAALFSRAEMPDASAPGFPAEADWLSHASMAIPEPAEPQGWRKVWQRAVTGRLGIPWRAVMAVAGVLLAGAAEVRLDAWRAGNMTPANHRSAMHELVMPDAAPRQTTFPTPGAPAPTGAES